MDGQSNISVKWQRLVVVVCAGILGVSWDIALMPIATGDEAEWIDHLVAFAVGGAMTGAVASVVNTHHVMWGTVSGTMIFCVIATVVGPKDGWIVLYLIFYSANGCVLGILIGLLPICMRRIHKFNKPPRR